MVDESFHEIRQHARNNVAIYIKLLAAIEKAAIPDLSREKAEVLWRHADLVAQSADLEIKAAPDRTLIAQQLTKAGAKLQRDFRPHTVTLGMP
jgi:uncharacterized membrane protein